MLSLLCIIDAPYTWPRGGGGSLGFRGVELANSCTWQNSAAPKCSPHPEVSTQRGEPPPRPPGHAFHECKPHPISWKYALRRTRKEAAEILLAS